MEPKKLHTLSFPRKGGRFPRGQRQIDEKALARNMSISDMKLPSGDGTQDIVYQLPHTRHISGIVAEVLGKSFTKERRQRSRKCRAKVRSSDRGNYQHPLKSNFLSSKKKKKRKKEGEKKTIKYVPSNTVKLNVFFYLFLKHQNDFFIKIHRPNAWKKINLR